MNEKEEDPLVSEATCRQLWEEFLESSSHDFTTSFFEFRLVIPELEVPAKVFSRHVPRSSRYWQGDDKRKLLEILDQLIEQFRQDKGVGWMEFFAQIQDRVMEPVQIAAGDALSLLGVNSWHLSVEQKKLRRSAVERMVEALGQAVQGELPALAGLLNESEISTAAAESVRDARIDWNASRFWIQRESIASPGGDIIAPIRLIHVCVSKRIRRFWQDAENALRAAKGVPLLGQGWASEAKLIGELRTAFPGHLIETQANPSWLGQQRFDGFFPDSKIAVEYQGEQHHKPVTMFGGKPGFVITQARDRIKKELCEKNGCRLVIVNPGYNRQHVIDEIRRLLTDSTSEGSLLINIPSGASVPRRTRKQIAPEKGKIRPRKQAALGAHDLRGAVRHGTEELIMELARESRHFRHCLKGKTVDLVLIAARAGNQETLKALLKLGWEVNRDLPPFGGNALALLCNSRARPDLSCVRILLEAGSDVKSRARGYSIESRCGYAPPMIGAALDANLPLAKLLVEFGASVHIRFKETGCTPLTALCKGAGGLGDKQSAADRTEMLRWLINAGANLRAISRPWGTALDQAVRNVRTISTYFPFLQILMELGVRISKRPLEELQTENAEAPTRELAKLIQYANSTHSCIPSDTEEVPTPPEETC